MLQDPAQNLSFLADRVQIAKGGEMGYTRGHYSMRATDAATHKQVSDSGSYVTVYRKGADWLWLAAADILIFELPIAFNSEEPTK
jgi:ketosteroid isomerase-like protein